MHNHNQTAQQLRQLLDVLSFNDAPTTTTVVLGTTLLGLAAGVVGSFALLRKRSMVTDALAHATLPGIAAAFIAASALDIAGKPLPALLAGAAVTGVIAVLAIQLILRHTRLPEDAAIALVLSVGFGLGIVGMSFIQNNTPANAAGLDAFIYGQTAAMTEHDAAVMAAIAAAAVAAATLLFKEFTLVCFNPHFARVDGWPTNTIDLAMMALVVLVTVAGLQAVGLLLVVAMLIIPPAAARFWTDRLPALVALAAAFGALAGYLGAAASAVLDDKPTGAVIVITAGAIFILSMAAAPKRGVAATAARRIARRLAIANDHLVERAFNAEQATPKPDTTEPVNNTARSLARQRGWSTPFKHAVLTLAKARGQLRTTPAGLALTERGRADGARVARNHRLWEQYLISYADIAPSHVDHSVDQVEHVLSKPLVRELEHALRKRGIDIRTQPHTKPDNDRPPRPETH